MLWVHLDRVQLLHRFIKIVRMVRLWVALAVILGALIIFALVDAIMIDPKRTRGVSKPAWVILIIVLPVVGALLWLTVGRGRKSSVRKQQGQQVAPDDDPAFTGSSASGTNISDMDARIRDLEEQLKALDDETFPGEEGKRDDG